MRSATQQYARIFLNYSRLEQESAGFRIPMLRYNRRLLFWEKVGRLMKKFRSAGLFILLQLLSSSAIRAQSLPQVLDAVSSNVKRFQEMIPDFVCNETVTSSQYESGKLVKQKVVESIFTGFQRSNDENRIRFAFTE